MTTSRLDRAFAACFSRAERLFDDIRARTSDRVGVTRAAYGEGEQIAYDILAAEAEAMGLAVSTDAAANLYMTLPGRDHPGRSVVVGSHLDSVPQGGNYDGLAGILAGLVCAGAMRRAGVTPPSDVTVMGIRGEENAWFGAQHVGSRAALGLLCPGLLDEARRFDTGRTLAEHMKDAGAEPDVLRAGTAHLVRERLGCYLELHIEQGPVLDDGGIGVGIVTGLRGNVRCSDIKCLGAYGHSGAVPRRLRRDAVMASAELVSEMDRLWRRIEDDGGDLVLTFGQFSTDADAHALTKIPGEVRLSFDCRSHSADTLAVVEEELRSQAREIGKRRDVRFRFGPMTRGGPALMDPGLRKRLAEGCDALGIHALELASGPGHDAGDFAEAGVPSAMIFVRNVNGSHNPDEAMPIEAFRDGTRLLLWLLTNPG